MVSYIQVLCLLGFIAFAASASLPDFWKACSRSDKSLNACATKSANAGWSEFVKGDKKLKIPSLNPFKLDLVDLTASESLSIKLSAINVLGLDEAVFKDINIDFDKKTWTIQLDIPLLGIECTYDVNGKILILPITGHGPGNITLANGKFTYNMEYELVDKKGVEHLKLINPSLSFTESRIYYQLDNLFNGDARLGPEMNRFLNENWSEVAKEIKPAINEALSVISTSILTKYFDKIPFNSILPK